MIAVLAGAYIVAIVMAAVLGLTDARETITGIAGIVAVLAITTRPHRHRGTHAP